MRVAAVGLGSGDDPRVAREHAVGSVRRAADEGAQLVVLPEYAARFDPRGVGVEHAEPLDGPFVSALRAVATQTRTTVLAGTVVPAGDLAANLVVAVGADGALLGTYAKVHLYDAFGQRESDRLVAGDPAAAPLVVDLDGLRVGVMTCYDLRFPESARRLVDAGATVLAVPAAWAAGPHKADQWETLLRARAIESCAYVLGAAQQGPGVAGDSLVVDPLGVVLARGSGGAAIASVEPAEVAAVRERNPSLVNRRYAVVPRG
ncbi:carbon-nitrogen hydrolase family protein [Cellulomonas sp. APG4]|uniref:carbon-nitrogen hydrolase family protein n=1 Tax=Cellulomonas sp. APG4 TaxID=1538656 RepID=UPI001379AF63|nr:carbon-nitrogen hydrolase family protein [Cellulomonas sp. APG4]NCT91168.1 carbon-nitrogen hydrolase family protein [Cellulomonas sp. APG4]